jgi:uncharacterized protein YgiM (DUF1202 family)
MRIIFFLGLVAVLCATSAFAQDADCLALIQAAIEQARRVCAETGINEVCYGSGEIEIQPRDNMPLVFQEPGDVVDAANISELRLSGNPNSYGIAIIRPRANLPATALSMIVFGEALLYNISDAPSDFLAREVTISTQEGANVREMPSTDGAIVNHLNYGQAVLAVSRTTDSRWIRVRWNAPGFTAGWVAAELLSGDFSLDLLQDSANYKGTESLLGPFQNSWLFTTPDNAPCSGAPDSGLIIQTPDDLPDSEAYIFDIGIDIYFRGTLYLSGMSGEDRRISVLEGEARVGIGGDYQTVQTGTLVHVPLIQGGGASGPPGSFEPYFYTRARNLPLALLPRQIELPFSMGGLIFQFEPGTGFLNTIPADGVCTVAWTADVNLRAGPGTSYPIRQGISGGYYAQPDARAVGSDGRLWWRLANEIWLAADNTAAAGACGIVIMVDAPPLPSESDG